MTLHGLPQKWETEAELLDGYGCVEAAASARRHAHELTEAIRDAENEELTLDQAARESGYSKRRIRELIADKSIRNAGRKGAPRIKRGDLLKKPSMRGAEGFDASKHAADILGGTA